MDAEKQNSCYICNTTLLTKVMTYRAAKTDAIFQNSYILKCSECGLLQIDKKFSSAEIEAYYKQTYDRGKIYNFSIAKFPTDNIWSVSRGRALAQLVKSENVALPSKFTVMDLGCGYGHLLFGFNEHYRDKCSIIGVDYEPETKRVFENYKWIFNEGGIDDVYQQYNNQLDVLITSHVFEHVINPKDFLHKCQTMLKKNGILLWEMPNLNEFNLLCESRHSPHICLWDIVSLRKILESQHLNVIFLQTAGRKYTWLDQKKPFNRLLKKLFNKIMPQNNLLFDIKNKESIAFQLNKYGKNRRNLRVIARKADLN